MKLLNRASARIEWRNRRYLKKALVTFLQSKGWLKGKAQDILAIIKACLAFLSASQARVVLINLEDLWLETQPQNIPSTREEYPNWRRKARYTLEAFCQMSEMRDTLREVDTLREQSSLRVRS